MDQRNLVIAVVLSILIMVGYEHFFAPPKAPLPQTGTEQAAGQSPGAEGTSGNLTAAPPSLDRPSLDAPRPGFDIPGAGAIPAAPSRSALLEAVPRVRIDTPRLHGSISLRGARIDDLTLADYHEEVSKLSPEIVLLKPAAGKDGYYSEFGWVPAAGSVAVAVPGPDTEWIADREVLTPDYPVTLRWENGAGLRFERVYAIDQDYMFTVTERVANTASEAVALHSYGLVQRRGTPHVSGFYIMHEGMLGYLGSSLEETTYAKLQEKVLREDGREVTGLQRFPTTGGWLGITDKYWMVVLIPDQKMAVQARYRHWKSEGGDRYQADYLGPRSEIAPGTTYEASSRLFAGAKEVLLIDAYEDHHGIPEFWRAIDFGIFHFLTRPIFYALNYIYVLVGNFGVSILILTVIIKLLFFPLANKSYVAMSKMKKLQPELVKLREQFGEDRARMNQEMMALYKREKANPVSGCLPMLIQIPVFFSLYKVLFVTIEMRQAPFYGWIKDLSQPDPTTIFNLFGLIPWSPPNLLAHLGLWPIIMGITMFFQQKLNPQPADPVQAKVFLFMPLIFTALLASFPAGLVIYWAWNNVLSIVQQWTIMRRMGVKA